MMHWYPSLFSGVPDYETFVGLALNLNRRENIAIFIAAEGMRIGTSEEPTSMDLLKEIYPEDLAEQIRLRQRHAAIAARVRNKAGN